MRHCRNARFHRLSRASIINELGPSGAILDVGAGAGVLTRKLLRLRYRTWAVEPNYYFRALIRAYDLQPERVWSDMEPIAPLKFDAVILENVLDVVKKPEDLLRACFKVARRSARLFLVVACGTRASGRQYWRETRFGGRFLVWLRRESWYKASAKEAGWTVSGSRVILKCPRGIRLLLLVCDR